MPSLPSALISANFCATAFFSSLLLNCFFRGWKVMVWLEAFLGDGRQWFDLNSNYLNVSLNIRYSSRKSVIFDISSLNYLSGSALSQSLLDIEWNNLIVFGFNISFRWWFKMQKPKDTIHYLWISIHYLSEKTFSCRPKHFYFSQCAVGGFYHFLR